MNFFRAVLKRIARPTVFLAALLLFACSEKKSEIDVVFDSSFAGARMNSVTFKTDDKFIAHVNPAFEPVNKSPWFAFAISADAEKEIELVLDYGEYRHRYIPKLSSDKKTWRKIAPSHIKIDTVEGTATLKLHVSQQKLYVAAQELESSHDTYKWLDSLVTTHPFLRKEAAGKTVLNNDNYVVTSNSSAKKSIVLIARQHPPEIPGGTVSFKAFYEELLVKSELTETFRSSYNIIAFPLLNPDGADMGNWRHNANGVDLNRDWVDFTQPETQMVRSYMENIVEAGNEIAFALDFHTSYSGPYMLVLDSINEVKTKKIIPNWIKNIEDNSQFKVETRRRGQELPYCYNYFFNQIGCEAVTYEEGDEIDRKIIKERAKLYARQLMHTMILMEKEK